MESQIIIDGVKNRSDVERVRAGVARTLIAALSKECAAYCILSGYDRLPDSFETDIDFMVHPEEFERMPRIIHQVAEETNTQLFHTVQHELSARSFFLGFQIGDKLAIVQPDATADYRHFGLLWLRSREVLGARRWHPRGFWIPSPQHEFAYYLIKRLSKRRLEAEHGLKLHRLYLLGPAQCDEMIARFWKGRNREAIRQMALKNDWSAMDWSLENIRSEMVRNSEESAGRRIVSAPKHMLHHLERIARPTGGCIAIIGPDGAGKSAIIDAIREHFQSVYYKVKCFHLRPKILRRRNESHEVVTDPHGKRPRSFLVSIAKMLFMLADYWLGYLIRIAPATRQSQLIVFDRYFYDVLVDSKRIRYGGPAWLLCAIAALIPRPELVILLDAPPEVLWSRKQEVAYEEVTRQRNEYLALAGRLQFATAVNAAQPLEDVIHDAVKAIVVHFERRTAKRFCLEPPIGEREHEAIQAPPGHRC